MAVETAGSEGAPAAYGLTYFFGVTGVILFIQILPKFLKISIDQEETALNEEVSKATMPFTFHHLELTNPNVFNKHIKDLHLSAIAPVVITRLLRKGADEPVLVGADTILQEGDHLRIAGREQDLLKIQILLGQPIDRQIEFDRAIEKRR